VKVAALGIDCSEPATTWQTLSSLPPVDLLVLPELAFIPWLCASRAVDAQAWDAAAAAQPLDRLADLPARVVIGTLARTGPAGRFNDAFSWTRDTGLQVVHTKTFLPDEPGFWEASWYRRGPVSFEAFDTPVGRVGVSVCTEMWFTQHRYPDVDLVVVPRATPVESTDTWLAGGVTHAVCSGAFCISSNRAEAAAGTTMGGTGWIIGPDGDRLAVTGTSQPAVVHDLDLAQAGAAKATYPRYVATD
jgi:N-carbamoylputrescine amidase